MYSKMGFLMQFFKQIAKFFRNSPLLPFAATPPPPRCEIVSHFGPFVIIYEFYRQIHKKMGLIVPLLSPEDFKNLQKFIN